MKLLSKLLFLAYILTLAWLVLLKFSLDLPSVLSLHLRSLNLIPFAHSNRGEIIANCLVFIPFGLLLRINFKRFTLWQNLAIIVAFSLSAEIIQYVLAIGVTDITDLLTNTAGGLLGLIVYGSENKNPGNETRDQSITIIGIVLLTLLMALRFFVFKVRY